jgi:hypothetical protein
LIAAKIRTPTKHKPFGRTKKPTRESVLIQGNEVVSIEFAVIQENTSFVLMEATQAMGGLELISGGESRTALVHMSISSADAASLTALFRCPWASPCDKFAFKQRLMEASDETSVKFVFDTVRKDGHPFLQLGGLYHNFDVVHTRLAAALFGNRVC